MRPSLRLYSDGSQRFKDTIRNVARLRAVIRQTEYGLIIEMSDGRMCALSRELCGPAHGAMTAALQWARRNGATSVEICD